MKIVDACPRVALENGAATIPSDSKIPGAAAVTGTFGYAGDPPSSPDDQVHEDSHFQMTVTRIHESPRVTLPYSEGQWRNIDALGTQVDGALWASDVRLTMGG